MASLYYPKPQPLSPLPTARWYMKEDCRYYQKQNGIEKLVGGVEVEDSIYYWWFKYLRLSGEYRTACDNNGKGYEEIYKDFGNVFDKKYNGERGFWKWWTENERGAKLFGVKAHGNSWLSLDEAMSLQNDIEENNIKLLAIPTNISKSAIKKRLNKLLERTKDIKKTEGTDKAKYPIEKSNIDVNSLKRCYEVYEDCHINKIDIFRIGCRLAFRTDELDELSEDGRTKKRHYKRSVLENKKGDEYWKLHKKVMESLKKKQKEENAWWKKIRVEQKELERALENRSREEIQNDKYFFQSKVGYARVGERVQVNYLSEQSKAEAMLKRGGRVTDKQRTTSKSAMRTNTYRSLRKAEANVTAVLEGTFGRAK